MKDQLGKRMKSQYEMRTRTYLPRRTYTIIRLDGKAFHTFTEHMERPYDLDFIRAMNETAKYLCQEIQGVQFGYAQSDEISLLLTDFAKDGTDAWFDGQVQKIVSISAAMATAKFNREMQKVYLKNVDYISSKDDATDLINEPLAFFDSRVYTIPDPTEVENYFIWRQKDATRNSLQMHAQSLYSHNELDGKSQADQHELIFKAGENWNNLPSGFKRGRTFRKYLLVDMETPGGIKYLGKEWKELHMDFLKEREELTDMIPTYS